MKKTSLGGCVVLLLTVGLAGVACSTGPGSSSPDPGGTPGATLQQDEPSVLTLPPPPGGGGSCITYGSACTSISRPGCCSGTTCAGNECVCDSGTTYCGGICQSPSFFEYNNSDCGSCGNACGSDTCCGTTCVNTSNDPYNCNYCGNNITGTPPGYCNGGVDCAAQWAAHKPIEYCYGFQEYCCSGVCAEDPHSMTWVCCPSATPNWNGTDCS
jgi:hypothetical protein